MKHLIFATIIASLTLSCRASFQSTSDASGAQGKEDQRDEDATVDDGSDRTEDDGSNLPIGGEDPNQFPPDDDNEDDNDDEDDDNEDPMGIKIRIVEPFGPGKEPTCPHGGKKIIEGIDLNLDGRLAPDEITSIEYLCDSKTPPKPPQCCCCCCCSEKHTYSSSSTIGFSVGEEWVARTLNNPVSCSKTCKCGTGSGDYCYGDDPGQNLDSCQCKGHHDSGSYCQNPCQSPCCHCESCSTCCPQTGCETYPKSSDNPSQNQTPSNCCCSNQQH